MTPGELRDLALFVIIVLAVIIILGMSLRIVSKVRRGGSGTQKGKKTRVVKAAPTVSASDDLYNTIASTRRIAQDLRMRGIDTGKAEELIIEADSYYKDGLDKRAEFTIDEAKKMLLDSKSEWDQKTGFGVVPSSPTPKAEHSIKKAVDLTEKKMDDVKPGELEEEILGVTESIEEKSDNYLPSKFTISLAATAVDRAMAEGAAVQGAQNYLNQAKAAFEMDDFDEAFRLALCSKREAEVLLGVSTSDESGEKLISDLATISIEGEELKVCSICGNRKVAYICVELDDGEEATCRECYDKSVGKVKQPDLTRLPPPPPPPKDIKEEAKETAQGFCPNCGAKVRDDDVFCGKCGKPVHKELKCASCGTKIEPGDIFCRKCGARMVT